MAKKKKHIGGLVMFGIFLIFVASMIIPALMRARRGAWRAVCLSNVRWLGQACKMYAIDNNEHFPDNLTQLYPNYIDDLKCFFCPEDNDRCLPRNMKMFNTANISYTIVPGLTESDDPNTPLVYDKSAWNHIGSGMNVFFIDGHASYMTAEMMVETHFDEIAVGLGSFFADSGRYPTNEEGLVILVASGYLKNVPVDIFDRDGKRPYDYATKDVHNNWILTCYGPDDDADINLRLYSKGQLSKEDLIKLKTEIVALGMAIKWSNGDIFRVGP